MPTKYKLLEKIPHTDYEVGHVFELESDIESFKFGCLRYAVGKFASGIQPHEILLMVKAGILEEVREEPKEEFKECFECAKKPGMATLCKQCYLVCRDFHKIMEK